MPRTESISGPRASSRPAGRIPFSPSGSARRSALLDTTSLVHESYLRFVGAGSLRLQDRVHFMWYSARVMRSVIVAFARRRDDGAQKRYLPAIKVSCEAGELPWVRYANIYDRSLFNENLPQRYGTHTRYNEQTRSEELYPLEDESRVDEWRREIGLPPLQEALAPLKIPFEPRKR